MGSSTAPTHVQPAEQLQASRSTHGSATHTNRSLRGWTLVLLRSSTSPDAKQTGHTRHNGETHVLESKPKPCTHTAHGTVLLLSRAWYLTFDDLVPKCFLLIIQKMQWIYKCIIFSRRAQFDSMLLM